MCIRDSLRTVHDDAVGNGELGAQQTERPRRIQQDQIGLVTGDRRFDGPFRAPRGKEKRLRGDPLYGDLGRRVKDLGVRGGCRGHDNRALGLETTPQFV